MATDPILTPLGLDGIVDGRGLMRDPATGALEQGGIRAIGGTLEFLRSLRFVLEKESAGSWATVLKAAGVANGKATGAQLDASLARHGKSSLAALPLDACLALLERHLALQGWGRIKVDASDANDHGFVVARLDESAFGDAFSDVDEFVDPLLAGLLAGFFQHISGEPLDCEEVACVRRGATQCVFVITAGERLAPLIAQRGREPADAIIARLKS